MKQNRTKNTKKNLSYGLIYKIITIVMPFCTRTLILYILGEKYLGLTSLFTSILQVLNLAELGFSSAIIYNMYKPIADGDDETVCKLLNYYRKIYRIIGILIFVVGLLIMPFINILIEGEIPSEINIYILYFIYLLDSSLSYMFFAYKNSLLNAMQRLDLVHLSSTITTIIKYILQIIILTIFKNYYLFVSCSIIFTVSNNIIINYISNKKYPQYKPKGIIEDRQKKSIKEKVTGLMIEKICDKTRNSLDSIVLSSFFGLTTVAIYNNYYYIFSAIYSIMLVITQSMQASIGNSIATEKIEKNYNDMLKFQFIFSWILCICCGNLLVLYQPFMEIWTGKDLLLSFDSVILLVIYFYVLNINNVRQLYFSGNGLWSKSKTSYILETIGNIILNIFLGKLLGINGVIIATIITIFIFNYVVRSNILFKEYFKISKKEYYMKQLCYFIITILISSISFIICNNILVGGIFGLILKLLINMIILNLGFYIIFYKNKEMKEFKKLLRKILKNKRGD